jgi:hypothetical protein
LLPSAGQQHISHWFKVAVHVNFSPFSHLVQAAMSLSQFASFRQFARVLVFMMCGRGAQCARASFQHVPAARSCCWPPCSSVLQRVVLIIEFAAHQGLSFAAAL